MGRGGFLDACCQSSQGNWIKFFAPVNANIEKKLEKVTKYPLLTAVDSTFAA